MGQFLLSKSNDNKFEIQGETSTNANVNDNSIVGTIFNAFAFKTNDSSVFEVRINKSDINNPYLRKKKLNGKKIKRFN